MAIQTINIGNVVNDVTQSRIPVDPCIVPEVIKLYRNLDNDCGIAGVALLRSAGASKTLLRLRTLRMRTNPYPWFADTFTQIQSAVGDLTIYEWWFLCGEPLAEYPWHVHNFPKTGVLYIQTPENSGGIEFRKQEEYYTHIPQAGEFLLFPGSLSHRILKNMSTDFRISVAFNFK